MMDDQDAGFTTNFKLVPWEGIGSALAAREQDGEP